MIIVGAVMNYKQWETDQARARRAQVHIDAQSLEGSINALAKLVNALKGASQGMQMIVLGIVVLLIGAGILGGSKFA